MGSLVVIFGVLLHLILIMSIFDIHFKSPIVANIDEVYRSEISPRAKRVVVFVTDGLGAHSIFNYLDEDRINQNEPFLDRNETKFLTSIMKKSGSWAISHSRTPTETRPGHIAILSGVYEDPSSIRAGWKGLTSDFDSVLNQSDHSFGWGSEGVLKIFTHGAKNFKTEMYSPESDDYENKVHSKLDTWIFSKVSNFFYFNEKNEELMKDRTIFLLALPSCDDAGHSLKPGSREYKQTIQNADTGIKQISTLINNFYKDNATAFLVTSDHGMTPWGSHVAGFSYEIQTPLIAWGAGIRKAENPHKVHQVNQVDIASLIATIIGAPIPKNSIGILPDFFLDLTPDELAHSYRANLRQIVKQYRAKEEQMEKNLGFEPFEGWTKESLTRDLNEIDKLIENRHSNEAITKMKKMITTGITGIRYYCNFYATFLKSAVAVSLIFWILILLEMVLQNEFQKNTTSTKPVFALIIGLVLGNVYIFSGTNMEDIFIFYCILPQIMLCFLVKQYNTWISIVKVLVKKTNISNIFTALLYGGFLFLNIFGFFDRRVFSWGTFFIGAWLLDLARTYNVSPQMQIKWALNMMCLSIFPHHPIIGNHSSYNFLLPVSECLWIGFAFYICKSYLKNAPDMAKKSLNLFRMQMWQIVCAVCLILIVRTMNLDNNYTIYSKFLSWTLAGTSMLTPLIGSLFIPVRLLHVSMALAVPYLLLSIAYEPILMLFLLFTTCSWIDIELAIENAQKNFDGLWKNISIFNTEYWTDRIKKNGLDQYSGKFIVKNEGKISLNDVRRSLFCIFFLIYPLFASGNISSINSFDPMWLKLFVTQYRLILMGCLLVLKLILPSLLVCVAYRSLNILLKKSLKKTFLLLIVFADIVNVVFFLLMNNEGSWHQIGSRLSCIVIADLSVVILLLFDQVSALYSSFKFHMNQSNAKRQ